MKKLVLSYICWTLLCLAYILASSNDEKQLPTHVYTEEQTQTDIVTRVAVVPRNTTQAIAPKMGEE